MVFLRSTLEAFISLRRQSSLLQINSKSKEHVTLLIRPSDDNRFFAVYPSVISEKTSDSITAMIFWKHFYVSIHECPVV